MKCGWLQLALTLFLGLASQPLWAGNGGHWNPEQRLSDQNIYSRLALEAIEIDSRGKCDLKQLMSDLSEIQKLAESSKVRLVIPLDQLTTEQLICYNSTANQLTEN